MNKGFLLDDKCYSYPKTVNFDDSIKKNKDRYDICAEGDCEANDHPYQRFNKVDLPELKGLNQRHYQEILVQSKHHPALAYFLYKHKGLTRKTRVELVSAFLNYISQMKEVNVKNLVAYFDELDSNDKYSLEYLQKVLFYIKKVVTFAYQLGGGFPAIELS